MPKMTRLKFLGAAMQFPRERVKNGLAGQLRHRTVHDPLEMTMFQIEDFQPVVQVEGEFPDPSSSCLGHDGRSRQCRIARFHLYPKYRGFAEKQSF